MQLDKIITLTLVLVLSLPSASSLAADNGDLEDSVKRMAKVGRSYAPSFSPDGGQIAFISSLSGTPQVWIVDSKGGWPRQVTAGDDQIGGVAWSPNGDWLAVSLAPGGGMNQQIYLVRPDGTGMRLITDGGKENNWLGKWTDDGARLAMSSNRDNPQSMDSYFYDVSGGELKLVAKNGGIGVLTDFSPSGDSAVVFRMISRGDNNLYAMNLSDGREYLLTPHEGPGSFGGGLFADGHTIYLSSNAGRDMSAFARITLDQEGRPGAQEIIAARDDAELAGFDISTDGGLAALMWNVAGRSELAFVDLETGAVTAGPELPAEIAGGMTFSPDGRRLAITVSGSASPTNIYVWNLEDQSFLQVTDSPHAGVDLDALIRPTLVQYKGHDGLELSGWLYRPRDAQGAGPMVLSFHGGPEGQARPSFRADYQALLAHGISVFAPNVRGSSGFGKRFVNLDNGALRFDGIKDIKSTATYLIEAGIATPGRIGIMGGSYGGYMTMAGLTEYPDLFAAGANLFGVVNFETFFAQTEPWMAAISKVEYGDPDTEADLLRRLSPIHKIDRVTAPVIVLHGANDTNVPVVEAEQVVESLRARNIPNQYILFPDEGHGFSKTPNRVRSTVSVVLWFAEHL